MHPKEKEVEDIPGPGAYDPHLGFHGPTEDDELKERMRKMRNENEIEPKLKIGPQTYHPQNINHTRGYHLKEMAIVDPHSRGYPLSHIIERPAFKEGIRKNQPEQTFNRGVR